MQRPAFPPEVRGAFDLSAGGTILNALRFALRIISGKNIYNFAILENLRIFQNCLFTGGVVEGNGICSAAFYESTALRGVPLPLGGSCRAATEGLWMEKRKKR